MQRRNPNKLYPHDHLMKWTVIPLIPKWITPNQVTILRFLLTPFVVWGLAVGAYFWSIPFFLLVAFTDVIDGSLARVRRQVTAWGTMFDPMADKLLISLVAVVVIVASVGWWLTIIVIFMEIVIVIGGLAKQSGEEPVSANNWGKAKMLTQVTGVTLLMVSMWLGLPLLIEIGIVVLLASVVLAFMSLITYGL